MTLRDRNNQKKDRNVVFHSHPSQLSFSLFTKEDILKLSVKKIYTPLTFNSLGHPLPGGLYDPVLGPLGDRQDVCQTCTETAATCPGHYGHIELPVLVTNPIFFNNIAVLLSRTCISCFRLFITDLQKNCLQMKLRLVEAGYLNEALDLLEPNDDKDVDRVIEFENKLISYEKLLRKGNSNASHNKNTESLRNNIISAAIREMKRPKKKCFHCQSETTNTIKSYHHRIMKKIRDDESNEMITTFMLPDECRTFLRNLWNNESTLIQELYPVLKNTNLEAPTDIFFFDILPVLPPNVRPVNFLNGKMMENPQTRVYVSILESCLCVRAVLSHIKQIEGSDILDTTQAIFDHTKGETATDKLHNAWLDLQRNINNLLDAELAKTALDKPTGLGIKQIIEKKEGIIRMHMMGKRVNFAARSVITPDPNLNIDEIGVPETFAMKLSYPVPVTPWNVSELRKMVMNGKDKHPGAVMVQMEDGTQMKIPDDYTQRESIAKRLLTPSENSKPGTKIVHRHLCNGDVMLLNRQPTLHKPSIMAHKVRILPGEKTLRLHYANCKAYNADFDGDEMNAHFPQNELARSEAYNIVNVCNQYLVPKDGTPLSGLIQDHMVSGVRLSIRGQFFNREDYHTLVYQGLAHIRGDIKLLPPAIIKPVQLWSGKQIISTLIINSTPKDLLPITLNSTAKISSKAWENSPPRKWLAGGTSLINNDMSESEVVIRKGELLCGVLDKVHYGATQYGLIHCMYELYGGTYSSKLLSSFAKLFTAFLQREGFTLGVHDILVLKNADKKRTKIIKQSRKIGLATQALAVQLDENSEPEKIKTAIEAAYSANPKFRAILDRQYKQSLDSYTNDINKTCLPAGLLCKFPYNNLQLMVQSGAKGSTVNTMQISCLLGQIELEGKRPPIMISGKSLPSFKPYEASPRAGGFIDGRFLTGIQPQEFFFHCMAGREGLIDTAVKTSRSGYLQRCLIKHLEGLTVRYDQTVRDSDNSVIQFLYGEQGGEISKVQFFNEKQFQFLSDNLEVIVDKQRLNNLKKDPLTKEILKKNKEIRKCLKKKGSLLKKNRSKFSKFSQEFQPDEGSKAVYKISKTTGRPRIAKKIIKLWRETSAEEKLAFEKQNGIPDPLTSRYHSAHYFGVLDEKLDSLMQNYNSHKIKEEFEDMIRFKAIEAICPPGEPVGLLAAQSIGEPSTQMTLNTFHFAGRGEMNVTLGIPRLREILMLASSTIKTPSMDIPFKKNISGIEKAAEKLRKKMVKVTVADVLNHISLNRVLELSPRRQHKYTVRFNFLPPSAYKSEFCIRPRGILKYMRKHFYKRMLKTFEKLQKSGRTATEINIVEKDKKQKNDDDNDADENDDADNEANKKLGLGENYQSSDDEEIDDEDRANAKKGSHGQDGVTYDDKEEGDEESDKETDEDEAHNSPQLNMTDEEDNNNDQASSKLNEFGIESYDTENHLWCQLEFTLPLSYTKVNFAEALKKLAPLSTIWETPAIKRGFIHQNNDELMLKTDGINFGEIFKYDDLLDLNKLYSNDIHAIARTYGIEAAGRVIVKEVQNVFKVYGITVDPRHLLLISDYMTYDGSFQPLSRRGMADSASPLQQMSFESSMTFLMESATLGKVDHLKSPSSCLIVGQPCASGTGIVSLKSSLY